MTTGQMVRIRMLTSIAGGDMNMDEGREYDVPKDVAATLCRAHGDDSPRAVPITDRPVDNRETRQRRRP